MEKCFHPVTQGRKGDKGSYCTSCGVKVMDVHDRPCSECIHYMPDGANIGICRHKQIGPMRVTANMHVTYYVGKSMESWQHGLCFEPAPPRS